MKTLIWKSRNASAVYKNGMNLFQVKEDHGKYKFIMFTKSQKCVNVECNKKGIENILSYFKLEV